MNLLMADPEDNDVEMNLNARMPSNPESWRPCEDDAERVFHPTAAV